MTSPTDQLILLRHEFLRRDGPAIGALQQGHRDRFLRERRSAVNLTDSQWQSPATSQLSKTNMLF